MKKHKYQITLSAEDDITVELELTTDEATGVYKLLRETQIEHHRPRNYEYYAPTMQVKDLGPVQ